jgi:hypothetical protein
MKTFSQHITESHDLDEAKGIEGALRKYVPGYGKRMALDRNAAHWDVVTKLSVERKHPQDEVRAKSLRHFKAAQKYSNILMKSRELPEEVKEPTGDLKGACWKGYTAVGTKQKNGKTVPNCVPVKEDAEQIDELSKNTLASYAKKSHRSAAGLLAVSQAMKRDVGVASRIWNKAAKRQQGVDRAVNRLAKEEVELSENRDAEYMKAHGMTHAEFQKLPYGERVKRALAATKKSFTTPPADHKDVKPEPAKKPEPKKGQGMPHYPANDNSKRYMGDSVEVSGETIDESKKYVIKMGNLGFAAGFNQRYGVQYTKDENHIKKFASKDSAQKFIDKYSGAGYGLDKSTASIALHEDSPAWQRKEGKNPEGGLNQKGVESYRRENPGSKLQTAVTTEPSKLKKGSKSANRRLSFCRRMKGMKEKLTSAETARDPDSRINKSLRKWNC